MAQGVGTLGTDGIIERRVNCAVRNPNVAATIKVNAVAIGVQGEIINGEVVHSGGQQAEMSSPQDGEVTQQHVAAVLQCDGFVAYARRFGSRGIVAFAAAQPFAPDEASPNDGDVMQVLAPDETVVKVGMAEVLVSVGGGIRLGGVVTAAGSALHRGFRCDNDR